MNPSFKDVEIVDMRLVILRILLQSSNYDANSSVICDALVMFGHHASRDQIHTQLAWLEENGLVTLDSIFSVQLAKLTQRGLDVAEGRAQVPGVKRPGPQ